MPPANPAVVAGIIAVSAAIAAAIAIYESPQFRRHADDVRRRIAMALHHMGDNVNPRPRYNRPEDVPPQQRGFHDGFRDGSHESFHDGLYDGINDGDVNAGVDADEESRRRQREELMYWNSVMLQKQREREERQARNEEARPGPSRGSSFDDFLKKDETSSEKGAYVINTGTDIRAATANLVYRRGDIPKARENFTAFHDNNPFSDSYRIAEHGNKAVVTPSDEMCVNENDDIYSSTTQDRKESRAPRTTEAANALIDFSHTVSAVSTPAAGAAVAAASLEPLPQTLERRLADDEFATATPSHLADEHHQDAFASIQAWAQDSTSSNHSHQPEDFYSPLPLTPSAPLSEPDMVTVSDVENGSSGELTPTDSVSLAGSGEDVAADLAADREGAEGRNFDVISESEGMATPASWSEVGSTVSDDDAYPG